MKLEWVHSHIPRDGLQILVLLHPLHWVEAKRVEEAMEDIGWQWEEGNGELGYWIWRVESCFGRYVHMRLFLDHAALIF